MGLSSNRMIHERRSSGPRSSGNRRTTTLLFPPTVPGHRDGVTGMPLMRVTRYYHHAATVVRKQRPSRYCRIEVHYLALCCYFFGSLRIAKERRVFQTKSRWHWEDTSFQQENWGSVFKPALFVNIMAGHSREADETVPGNSL